MKTSWKLGNWRNNEEEALNKNVGIAMRKDLSDPSFNFIEKVN